MNDYGTAWDTLARAIGAAQGHSSGSITEAEHLNIDQQIEAAKVAAILSVAQEVSGLRDDLRQASKND
ncbi:MAG: hypothetical protein ACK5LO_00915 [Leucobacter sp.]